MPDLSYESRYEGLVAGVDEVGRGPWAGPVVAAAVILPPSLPEALLGRLRDSKKLLPPVREEIAAALIQQTVFSISEASVEEIDALNIFKATLLAMKRAVLNLSQKPAAILVDGTHCPPVEMPAQAIVGGDDISCSIAAASIIAKVHRDRYMKKLAAEFPHYGWDTNAGYGTPRHREAMRVHGLTMHHRRSYQPVREQMERALTTQRISLPAA